MSGNKFLLVKGRAGLGDRIQCLLTGILYARLTGRRLLVDWSDSSYSNDKSNAFHRYFQCSLCSPADEIPSTVSVSPSIWLGHLHESSWDMGERYGINKNPDEVWRRLSIDLTKLDYREDVLVMQTYNEKIDLLRSHFEGRFKELSRASTKDILSKLLREDLILNPLIKERVDRFKNNNFIGETVGVHVRYADHRVSLLAILDKLNILLRREPGLQVFLATDNIQIKKMFEENYPGVITTSHWYPKPGSRLHNNQDCPDPLEGGIEALVDLYLLAECTYLIIDTSSSFSYVARLLTKAPDSNIFDVKRGGKLPAPLRRLTWKIMVRLGLFSWGLDILRRFVRIKRLFSA